ncbi:MAG: bifunctional protein-serine/threonine kinase/phosphatase [Proteobacteria bacterium]|nr:bifunctional protein-serine/threonine kinase/phosphatase [Pseudomonadota bacterium]
MPGELRISIGQHSDKGRKAANQDFHGAIVPNEPQLSLKGAAIAVADGISSSNVSQIASESAVGSFLSDYYCTSETWSVKTSAHRVLAATNSWLNSQTRHSPYQYDRDKGYVCTFSAIVIKSATAHVFSIGDTRVYRVAGRTLEQLTEDHRVVVSSEQSYLSRALGVDSQVEIDYLALPVAAGDTFVLATDGVYEHLTARTIVESIERDAADLDRAAASLVKDAYDNGSADNLTIQIVRIDQVPNGDASEVLGTAADLPLPPLLEARAIFDGYRIVREVHASSRSHIYLAIDIDTDTPVALKIPSIDLRGDPDYLKRFMMEEWVARRIASPYVLKPHALTRKRNFLYTVVEFVEGQTLHQWMIDNPKPPLETVRQIVEQIALGLGAFHRLEMLHQDLRPHNIMIDTTGTAKIIDFGSTRIAGVAETAPDGATEPVLGTVQYTAPECLLGEVDSPRADLFSLGVIGYQMLTGKLPYGGDSAKARTPSQFQRLTYRPATSINGEVPVWVDGAVRRAVHPNPLKRYEALSEFVFDLRHPKAEYLDEPPVPLLERNPLLFWQASCGLLAVAVLLLLARLYGAG